MKKLLNAFFLFVALLAGKRVLQPSSRRRVQAEEGEKKNTLAGKIKWKHRLVTIGVFLLVLAAGGALVVVSGVVPIKASSGHWAITRWFLSFSMHRSVATHSMGITIPALDSPAMVLKGAGQYETACRPCHGSPDLPQPRIARQMTPHPPYLPPTISKWASEELFYIVKHGVKFTGMPAWPTLKRDDEVWAMVAFLRQLPDLDAAAYQRLVEGETATGPGRTPLQDLLPSEGAPATVLENCARCHGADGQGRGLGAFPKLAGQRPTYLYAALQAYADGRRHSGLMEPVAAGLSREEMQGLARYYANLPPAAAASPVSAPEIARGRAIAQNGIPGEGIPSCVDCHGPGNAPRNPFYPNLAGQYADYIVLQLELFSKDHRGGSAYAHLMHLTAERLTPEQMRDVAHFYESLGAAAESPAP